MELTTVWFALIAVLWVGYFCLEGFDFGVGMLLPVLSRNETERRVMINTIGPVWDGNEVWVLVAGGATFAAFPEWYATLFSGFYLPLLMILVALIVRGLSFEYRHKREADSWKGRWDLAIIWGSFVPARAVGRRLRQHRRGRADRRRQGVHRHAPHPAQPLRPAGRARHPDALRHARCDVRRAQDRRRHPPPRPRPGGTDRRGRRRAGRGLHDVDAAEDGHRRLGGRLRGRRAVARRRPARGGARPGGLGVRRHLPHDRPRRRRPVRGAVPRRDAVDDRPRLLADHHQRGGDGVHAEGDDVGRGRSSPRSCSATRRGPTGCSASGSRCTTSPRRSSRTQRR